MYQVQHNSSSGKYGILIFSLVCSILLAYNIAGFYGILVSFGIALFIFMLINFFFKAGHDIPVKEITVIIFCLQFILGPFWAYYFFEPDIIYDMKVPDYIYFEYAIPAIIALSIGLFIVKKNNYSFHSIIIRLENNEMNYYKIGKILLFISIFTPFLSIVFPLLGFVFFLSSTLGFVGAYYIHYSKIKARRKYKWYLLSVGIALFNALNKGMFHELFVWALFSILIFSLRHNFNILKKTTLFGIAIFVAMSFESVKLDYRENTWYTDQKISVMESLFLYSTFFNNLLENPSSLFSTEYLEKKLVRINIGNIASRVINHVPFYEPYANGETILTALETALVPRFLNPDRITSGGRENYIRFTGFDIDEDTSISIGILGEAYANFGSRGGIIFMFFWGLFISLSLKLFFNYLKKYPDLLFWMPFIFSQTIKAEIDVVPVLNYMTKSALLTFIIFYFFLKNKRLRSKPLMEIDS